MSRIKKTQQHWQVALSLPTNVKALEKCYQLLTVLARAIAAGSPCLLQSVLNCFELFNLFKLYKIPTILHTFYNRYVEILNNLVKYSERKNIIETIIVRYLNWGSHESSAKTHCHYKCGVSIYFMNYTPTNQRGIRDLSDLIKLYLINCIIKLIY